MRTFRLATIVSLMMLAAVMSFLVSVQPSSAEEFPNVPLSTAQKPSLAYATHSIRD